MNKICYLCRDMYNRIIKPILFALKIEQAHRLVVWMLRIVGMIPGGRWLLGKSWAVEHPALEREVFGMRFRNPIGLAAGFDRNGEIVGEAAAMGFGFIEVGAVTPHPQEGNPRPRVFRLAKDRAIINRMGLPNRGLERMIRNLHHGHKGIVLGCNIAKDPATPPSEAAQDYLKLFRNLYQYVDYFTVNISCVDDDSTSHSRDYLTGILEPLFDFRRGQNRYRPIMVKISADATDEMVDTVTDILIETPLDGVVAANGTFGREGLRTSRANINKIGGGRLGGAPLKERTVEIIRRVHTRSGGTYPIIGVGGAMSAGDVKAMLDAGADLVQLYTGFIYEGPQIVGDICRSMIAEAEAATPAATETTEEPAAAEAPRQ